MLIHHGKYAKKLNRNQAKNLEIPKNYYRNWTAHSHKYYKKAPSVTSQKLNKFQKIQ